MDSAGKRKVELSHQQKPIGRFFSNFTDDEIYNTDETGLFSTKLYRLGHCVDLHNLDLKTDKSRITCLIIVNKSGNDKQLFNTPTRDVSKMKVYHKGSVKPSHGG